MSQPEITVRLATPDDAEAYTHCYIECLAETYAHIMPPEFAQARRDRFAEEAASNREELTEMAQQLSAGGPVARTHWVAEWSADPAEASDEQPPRSATGREVVGIVSSGPGVAEWERSHFDNPAPLVDFNLDHIYTRSATHGTGLGRRLLETALPGGRGAWLWILRDNPRAEAFYRRQGFVEDGLEVLCGPAWFNRPMFRMWRPDPS